MRYYSNHSLDLIWDNSLDWDERGAWTQSVTIHQDLGPKAVLRNSLPIHFLSNHADSFPTIGKSICVWLIVKTTRGREERKRRDRTATS